LRLDGARRDGLVAKHRLPRVDELGEKAGGGGGRVAVGDVTLDASGVVAVAAVGEDGLDGVADLDAAERHADARLAGDALALAELAVAGFGRDRSGALVRAKALVREMRLRLQRPDTAAGPVASLTRREMEVATLAAKGMSDRDIGDVLVVSVRTVESHLAAIYRKLGITSRRGLRDALEPPTTR
jgi:DNA-binding CsgD family transcriptional regulator